MIGRDGPCRGEHDVAMGQAPALEAPAWREGARERLDRRRSRREDLGLHGSEHLAALLR